MKMSVSQIRQASYAIGLDKKFPSYAQQFSIPKDTVYFCGNSLGLMPKRTKTAVNNELTVWQNQGVTGHFDRSSDGLEPWVSIDAPIPKLLAPLIGAKESEVAVMGTLTSNLHMLLARFYRPVSGRAGIIYEAKAFPSDEYAFQSQAKLHGYTQEETLYRVSPREGEYTLRTDDILKQIEKLGEKTAVVLFSGIQFYTGQYFEMEKITKAAHAKGCVVGWDLAHAVGNVPVKLHDWGVDFAVFCSYKYLNSGPGGIGGIFVHERHHNETGLAGWWSNRLETRFGMKQEFDPIVGAEGFRVSNPSVLNVVCLQSSLEVFSEVDGGIEYLRERSKSMTQYLWDLFTSSEFYGERFVIITPEDPDQRGAQLSILFKGDGEMKKIFDAMAERNIITDEREPNVIRIAPNHLYNTHEEVLKVFNTVEELIRSL